MNWGVIGYGEIAPFFIKSLLASSHQNLYAIASVSKHATLKSTNIFPNTKIYSSYDDLYLNTDIDIVYIATTNNLHKENVINCLLSGKHVLCEKPIGVSKSDVCEMIEASQKSNRFLMEGMWTRFLPAYRKFIEFIRDGSIGRPEFASIDFGFFSTWGNERRLLNKNLYGGALLDNTDYNLFACVDIFNSFPEVINSFATHSETGVENKCNISLKFPDGGIANCFSSFIQQTHHDAIVYGSKGWIKLKEFWHSQEIEIKINNKETRILELPFTSSGFYHEIQEVQSCIQKNKIESSIIPHQLSIDIASITDKIFEQIKK